MKLPKNSRLRNKTIGFTFFYFTWMFLFLSFLGWLWEICLYLVTEQRFVNRGILFGPWLPIYGAGGISLFLLFYSLKGHPVRIFLLSALTCSALEYFCSWFLEQLWGIRWWDYSDFYGNLNGRICLLGSVMFGIGALLAIYLIIPWFEKLYENITPRIRKTVGLLLLLLFLADGTYAAVTPNTGTDITYRPSHSSSLEPPPFLCSLSSPSGK